MNYWTRKDELKQKAREHDQWMEQTFRDEINFSAKNTTTYSQRDPLQNAERNPPEVVLMNTDSVSAIFSEEATGKIGVLNFASYKNPGGMFMNGSSAQEESLCHESSLYNVLKRHPEYYAWNNEHKNKALYLNRALASPDVVFTKGRYYKRCLVITCAAPNYGAAAKYQNVSKEENSQYLRDRILFVKDVAEHSGLDTIILGAFGCGVFKQDAQEVADIMSEVFGMTTIKKVIYAVPGNDANYKAFKEKFS